MSAKTMHAGATTSRLTRAIDMSPPHLKPVLGVVRDFGVGMLFVEQGPQAFRIPRTADRRPAIVLIGDDMEQSLGPDQFHFPSVRRAIRCCSAFAVVSAAPDPAVYAGIALGVAEHRSNALIVETRIEHEFQWVALIRKLAPRRPICILTVKGGNA